jgi:hypothetical protein
MKINFTKKEYQTLVEMLLLADWVIHGHEEEPVEDTRPYLDLRKKVLSHYKEMGMAEDFKYEPEMDDYFETADYEARAPHMQFIDAYDERVFWLTLASKLAHRDLAAEDVLRAGPPSEEERIKQLFERIGRYEDAFAEHGLDSIQFVSDTPRMH